MRFFEIKGTLGILESDMRISGGFIGLIDLLEESDWLYELDLDKVVYTKQPVFT